MINEYLILSDKHREIINKEVFSGIEATTLQILNKPIWIIRFSTKSNDFESAKKLSEIHEHICEFEPVTLTCESSEYYNKRLFPIVNEFERKLRKLLYLAASVSDNDIAKVTIKRLEEKDFGEIFDLLFIDSKFIISVKKKINGQEEHKGKDRYTRVEIKNFLDNIVEATNWDDLLGSEAVPTLKEKFREVHYYRNTVMHAHNISEKVYIAAQKLYKEINDEINAEIAGIMMENQEPSSEISPNFNTVLSSGINEREQSESIEGVSNFLKYYKDFVSTTIPRNEILEFVKYFTMKLKYNEMNDTTE